MSVEGRRDLHFSLKKIKVTKCFLMNVYKIKKRTTLSSPNAESKPAETITRSGENFMQEEEKRNEY